MQRVWLGAFALLLAVGPAGCDDTDTATPAADMAMGGAGGGQGGAGGDGGEGGGQPDAALAPGELVAEAVAVEFGQVVVRGTGEAELPLRNDGESALRITAFEGLAAPFASALTLPILVPAGQRRAVLLTFTPDEAGPAEQTVRIVTDVPDTEPIQIALTGEGVRPEGTLETPALDFGVVAPGVPAGDFIQVLNTSPAADLTLFGVDGLEAPFAIPEGQLPVTAEPGASAQVLVQFAPEADGEWTQTATLNTNAGPFEITLSGRAISVGDLVVRGVEPAWAPVDEAVTLTVHGGPFEQVPTAILIGDVPLRDLERLDDERVTGTLPADAQAPAGIADARVEIGGTFGVAAAGFVRTPPIASGQPLDADALAAGPIGPAGNPWALAIDAIPAETEVEIEAGTVILAGDAAALHVEGTLRSAGVGPVIFSSAARAPGAWAGLRFADATPASSLDDLVIEFAGAGETPAIESAQAATFTRLRIRQATGPGLAIGATGTLVVLGGEFTDLDGDAMTLLTETGGVFRLQDTLVRRAGWPVRAQPVHFGGRPIGSGHDWAGNALDGVALQGPITGAATLSSQPAEVRYHLPEPLVIAAGGSLSLATAAPLRIDDTIEIAGTLTLPPGGTYRAEAGGHLVIAAGGTLSARGTVAEVITIHGREAEAPNPGAWTGITLQPGGTLDAENLVIRDGGAEGPMVRLLGAFDIVRGLQLEASADYGLEIAADGSVINARWNDNAVGSVQITAGAGRITGLTTDPAPAAVFEPVDLCGAWELPAFRRPDGEDAPTNCPAE